MHNIIHARNTKGWARIVNSKLEGSNYSFIYSLVLECNASAAGIGLMMNGNITKPTFSIVTQNRQLSEY